VQQSEVGRKKKEKRKSNLSRSEVKIRIPETFQLFSYLQSLTTKRFIRAGVQQSEVGRKKK